MELLKVEFLQDLSSAVLKQFCLYVPCGFWYILPILDRYLFVHYPCYITDQLQTSFILYLLEFIQIKCITRSCYNAMFSWETLGPGIHVDVSLTHTAYLSICADQTQHTIAMTLSIGTPSRTVWPATEYHRLTIVYKAQGVDPASKLIRATYNPKFTCRPEMIPISEPQPSSSLDLKDL